jgi:uncharacterized membrane protein HdeD (DUF308 family)
MKTILYAAAFLLLLTGVLHLIPIFKTSSDPNALPMMVFGILYLAVGVLLLMKKHFAIYLGIIVPAIGLLVGFFVVGIKNWDTMLCFLFGIDAVVIICCGVALGKGGSRSKE